VVPGTEGYADDAAWLIPRYAEVSFEEKYQAVWHLLASVPGSVLDLGAGAGTDSAWLAKRGHRVTAVEPVAAFRDACTRLHPSLQVEWIKTWRDTCDLDPARFLSRESARVCSLCSRDN